MEFVTTRRAGIMRIGDIIYLSARPRTSQVYGKRAEHTFDCLRICFCDRIYNILHCLTTRCICHTYTYIYYYIYAIYLRSLHARARDFRNKVTRECDFRRMCDIVEWLMRRRARALYDEEGSFCHRLKWIAMG